MHFFHTKLSTIKHQPMLHFSGFVWYKSCVSPIFYITSYVMHVCVGELKLNYMELK